MRTRPYVAAAIAAAALAGAGAMASADRDRVERSTAPAEIDGATLFQLKGCAQCHQAPDAPSAHDPGVGPSLVGVASWAGTRRPGVDAEGYVRESIVAPDVFVARTGTFGMPMLPLTADEVDRLVGYLVDG